MNNTFPSKIFIDGGVPEETKNAKKMLGFLDGQTTNPSLIAKNLESRIKNQESRENMSEQQALDEYKRIVNEMSNIIPKGSVSIQVFANENTSMEDILNQARVRNSWIKSASIKIPCIPNGLKAGEILCKEMALNFTLVFSQSQAAAVYEATREAKHPVFLSPFVGRLDDRGENGMDVIKNIMKLFSKGDGHVECLTASVRSLEHLKYALYLHSNIVTIPFKVFKEWGDWGFEVPDESYTYDAKNLAPIAYDENIKLGHAFNEYDLHHDLTDKGVASFWKDWNGIIA